MKASSGVKDDGFALLDGVASRASPRVLVSDKLVGVLGTYLGRKYVQICCYVHRHYFDEPRILVHLLIHLGESFRDAFTSFWKRETFLDGEKLIRDLVSTRFMLLCEAAGIP